MLSVLLLCNTLALSASAQAGWLTRALSKADTNRNGSEIDAQGNFVPLKGDAGRLVVTLPADKKAGAIVVGPNSRGEWALTNATGETRTIPHLGVTHRGLSRLGAGAKTQPTLRFYVTAETALHPDFNLAQLTALAKVEMVLKGKSYPLEIAQGSGELLLVLPKNLRTPVMDRQSMQEAAWHSQKLFSPNTTRIISLQQDGVAQSLPRIKPTTQGQMQFEAVQPTAVFKLLESVRGQTLVFTGSVRANKLTYQLPSGGKGEIDLNELKKHAEAADVNLAVVGTRSGVQPGSKTALGRQVKIQGLSDAMKASTNGEFFSLLSPTESHPLLTTTTTGRTHVVINMFTEPKASSPADIGEELLTIQTIQAFSRSEKHQKELNNRLFESVHSRVQWIYLWLFVGGIYGREFAILWWRKIWPNSSRPESPWQRHLANSMSSLLFVALFMPLSSPLSMPVTFLHRAYQTLRGIVS